MEESSTKNIENHINSILAMYLDLEPTKANCKKTAKEKYYPTGLSFNDLSASVNVESLLNHTTERILLTLSDEELHELRGKKLILYGKWGMDGVSGQQTTTQK
ncbi:hypothetical protein ALC60_06325 [Trachymyrmex zeteki]|uniref:Uncharacterized protein n=1 Tax=Mycetomoellerius zeteki TaxID=64791 RepID=A0A151X2V8_9HYME|nr:hypothetical protein ALC60_06325 [Trachymyrmex zeteki]